MHAVMSKQRDERPNASSIDGIAYSVGIHLVGWQIISLTRKLAAGASFLLLFSHKKAPLLIAKIY